MAAAESRIDLPHRERQLLERGIIVVLLAVGGEDLEVLALPVQPGKTTAEVIHLRPRFDRQQEAHETVGVLGMDVEPATIDRRSLGKAAHAAQRLPQLTADVDILAQLVAVRLQVLDRGIPASEPIQADAAKQRDRRGAGLQTFVFLDGLEGVLESLLSESD